MDMYLAGKADVDWKIDFHQQPVLFQFADFARITFGNLDPASCATRISAASVEDINPGILKGQNQFSSIGCFNNLRTRSCVSLDSWHNLYSPELDFIVEIFRDFDTKAATLASAV